MKKFFYGALLGSLLLLGSFAPSAKASEMSYAIICKEKSDADIVAHAMYNVFNSLDAKGIRLIVSMRNKQLCWVDEIFVPPWQVSVTRVPDIRDTDAVYVVFKVLKEGHHSYAVILNVPRGMDV